MGIFDGIRDEIEDAADEVADNLADRTGKVRTGFDPEVCVGCPQRGDGPLKPCGLCGCPTIRNGTLHRTGMTPEDCRRATEHERRTP